MAYYDIIFFLHYSYLLMLFIILFFITESYSYISVHNHITTRLNNGNFLVISSDGIYTLDPAFNLYNKTNEIINTHQKEDLVHFSEEDGGYILFISGRNHYVFSPYGELVIGNSFLNPVTDVTADF